MKFIRIEDGKYKVSNRTKPLCKELRDLINRIEVKL